MPGDEGDDYLKIYSKDGSTKRIDNVAAPVQTSTETNPTAAINGQQWLTPADNSLQAIQDLIDNYKHPNIRLIPGELYQGDTQLTIDIYPDGTTPRNVRIKADGAGVAYTGADETCLDVYINKSTSNQNETYDSDATFVLEGGTWYGPGKSVANSCAVRTNDIFGARIAPSGLRGAINGLLVRNYDLWSEGNDIEFKKNGKYAPEEPGDINNNRVDNTIRLAGQNSSYPNCNGTASYKDTHIHAPFITADNNGVAIWQDGGGIWGGTITAGGFTPPGGTFFRHDFSDGLARFCTAYIETEGGDSNSTDIEINSSSTPLFINPRTAGDGQDVGGSNGQLNGYLDNGGWRDGPFHIRQNADLFSTTLMRLYTSDGEWLRLTNRQDEVAFRDENGNGFRFIDSTLNPTNVLLGGLTANDVSIQNDLDSGNIKVSANATETIYSDSDGKKVIALIGSGGGGNDGSVSVRYEKNQGGGTDVKLVEESGAGEAGMDYRIISL